MAEMLTPQQKDAVYNRGGKLLVSAAAGSGKTKVLVDRLLTYLTDEKHPANIDDFLIITFTEAAAAELRGKIASKINEKIVEDPANKHLQRQIQRLYLAKISTVHAFCSGILKENAYRLDLSVDFRLADEKESAELKSTVVERILNEAYNSNDPDFFAFIDTQGLGRSDYLVPQIILDIYEKSRCHLNPAQWLDDCVLSADVADLEDASQTVWGQYLIQDLHSLVDLLIKAMENCVNLIHGDPAYENPAAVLQSNVDILKDLRNRTTWKEIMAAKDLSFGTLRYQKDADPELKELIKATRDRVKKLLTAKFAFFSETNEQALLDIKNTQSAIRGIVSMVHQFSDAYTRVKKMRRLVDFSDLEHMTLDLLVGKNRSSCTALAEEIGARFVEVMVDEYQDTNEVQDCIFAALTAKRQNCFMVGDVKQSIYQFRLADPGIFIEKYNTYDPVQEATPRAGRKVMLSSNFRSSGSVIDAVNDIFSQYMSPQIGGLYYGEDEMLYEGIPHAPLHEPSVEFHAVNIVHDRYTEEPAFVAERIAQLLDGTHMVRDGDAFRPIKAEDIVILLRSPGSVGADYQCALERRGIRCVREKSRDLLKTEEISVLRSLLQCISNPLQDIPLAAAAVSRAIGMTADDLAQVRCADRDGMLYDALRKSELTCAVNFSKLLSKLRRTARMVTLTELIDQILSETAMDSIYSALPDGDERISNIYMFTQLVASFESNNQGNLERLLQYLDNMEQGKGFAVSDDSSVDAVRIMSIHMSKGLEFPVVFVCALSKGFNDDDLYAPVICDSELGLGLNCADMEKRYKYPTIARKAIAKKMKASSFSEEMRVLYVALTRAKDRLIMTYSRQNVEKHIQDLSLRMQLAPKELMALDAGSVGDWVLMTAMQRSESGKLYSGIMRPNQGNHYADKWYIDLIDQVDVSVKDSNSTQNAAREISQVTLDRIKETRNVQYAYAAATKAPSKQTATQMKGRYKDQEASDGTAVRRTTNFRKPSFIAQQGDSRAYGTAMHAVMQHIAYDACDSIDGISAELSRLAESGLITEQQAALANISSLFAFFQSECGQKLIGAEKVLREFKFSILDDGERYADGLQGEKILLQGVVDCVLVENDGLTIIDFKTDRVSKETITTVAKQYEDQVRYYALAMSRIYKLPIKATVLYFFNLGEMIYV